MIGNPLFDIDFYKVGHKDQYPNGTTEIYSNFTPRYVIHNENIPVGVNKVVMFGLQQYIQDVLITAWNYYFFKCDIEEIVESYTELMKSSLGLNSFDCSHIRALHELGYLPIHIKAIPEGMLCPIGIPVLTVVNTHPDFYWLTNYIESSLSANIWKPITVATIAYQFKKLCMRYAYLTCSDFEQDFQVHDFSFRGMSGSEDAAICGAAHLTSFYGTDCVPAIRLLQRSYSGHYCHEVIGASVPATEHSVMTVTGQDGEFETIKRLITEVYPKGIVSIVADSYDLWRVITDYLPRLKNEINNRQGTVVIRPDSGDPFNIICGDIEAEEGSPAHKGVMKLLWETFGGTYNEKCFKVLNPKISVIYGDSITVGLAEAMFDGLMRDDFASSNIILGVGSYSYNYLTRDNFGFAMKATSAVVKGKRIALCKDPVTGSKKKSLKGLLAVRFNRVKNEFSVDENVSEEEEKYSVLSTVFLNGKLVNTCTLKSIRSYIKNNLRLE